MEFSIATLLANFTDDKLVARKVLEKKLGCEDDESLEKLQIALDVLEKIGILVKERGKYRRVGEEGTIEAKLRCSSKGFCFAIQESEGEEDIYIRESHLNSAWNGDRVLVKMTKEGSRRRSPEGEVRLILERSNQSLLARIKQANNSFRAVPLDDRLLFELELANENNLAEVIDHLAHVEILRYPLGQSPPLGRVVQILGSDAEAASDIDLVCCKHDLKTTFSPAVLEAAASLSDKLSKTELIHRLDLRQLFTIAFRTDSPDAVENAFTLEKTDTEWRLGVHVTDVAHYVELDSPIDRESLKRGSCVYLGETVLPMLPEGVFERCSLVPGSDRLSISVLLTLDPTTGSLVEFEIQPSVIQVDQQLTQQQAAAILNRSAQDFDQAVEMLFDLSRLSQAVKEQRLASDGFELKLSPPPYPQSDEGALGVISAELDKTRSLLTELVLLSNQAVADHLLALTVPAIFRIQPPPDAEEVQETIKLAHSLGVGLSLDQDDKVKPQDYQRFTSVFADSPQQQVLTYLLRDTLKPALYSTAPGLHFGLARSRGYIRSNSPLRRYPDLLIQRVLHTVFQQGRDRRTTRAKEHVNLRHSSAHGNITWNVLPPEVQQELESDLAKVIVQLNDREKEILEAEADLEGLQKAALMKERTGQVFQGLITGVQSYGFFVEIEVPHKDSRMLIEGLVHVSSLKDDWYEYRNRQQALFGRKNRASYRLGDWVSVQVKSVDYYRQQIDLVTVNGSAARPLTPADDLDEAQPYANNEETDTADSNDFAPNDDPEYYADEDE